jgi:heat-inducible transcriptional repressor
VKDRDGRQEVLDVRKWEVLSATVSGYIRSALPVGSQSAGRSFGLTYSPATIRNIMSELEALGYLTHPHTSAGRIPTEKGFRYFVDHTDFPDEDRESWESLSREIEPILADAPLSEFGPVVTEVVRQVGQRAGYAGFVVETGTASEVRVVAVEACPLSERHALLVVILETGHLLKRTFSYPEGIGWPEFRRIVSRMNRIGRNSTLSEIMEALLLETEGISLALEALLVELARLGGAPDVRLFGASRFAKVPEFSNVQELESVFEAFEQQVSLFGFFRKFSSLAAPRRIVVSIGSENELPGLDSCAMVSIPLSRYGAWYGTIGVVGPVRMAYGQVIPLMARLSERLNLWLSAFDGEE